MATDFRKVERKSNFRANILFLESVAVALVYLAALGNTAGSTSAKQRYLLSFCGVFYMIRLNVMARWLLKRELAMEELTVVPLLWLPSIMASYAIRPNTLTTSGMQPLLSFFLYVLGSYLNSYSELQRKWWKEKTFNNNGRCYTQGLFSWSRNINYFGDVLLFSGWALATGNWYNLWAPFAMACSFWFYHIPQKETYLAQRYAKDWPAYKKKTPYALVPFVC